MIGEYLQKLAACGSGKEVWSLHRECENSLTPLELSAIRAVGGSLPQPTQAWLESLEPFMSGELEGYLRRDLAPNIALYRDPAFRRAGKRLVIAFCGHVRRLMMPISRVLQCLPSRQFDVVLLKDASRQYFLRGVPGASDSLFALLRFLTSNLPLQEYEAVYCYGTSAGAFTALRAGILLRAERAVSVGGRFHGHASRIALATPLPAFDPLCHCYRQTQTVLTCVFAAAFDHDRHNAEHLSKIVPVEHLVIPGASGHIPFGMLSPAQLQAFFGRIFGFKTRTSWESACRVLAGAEPAGV